MMEQGASGIAGDAAPGRFASGAVAMFTGGSWYAAAIEAAQPGFEWGYIRSPAATTRPTTSTCSASTTWSSPSPATREQGRRARLAGCLLGAGQLQAFVDAVQFIPTQSTATLNAKIGQELAPYLANFKVGFEQYWIAPKGAGTYAAGPILPNNLFKPFGEFDDPQAAATKSQADLDSDSTQASTCP